MNPLAKQVLPVPKSLSPPTAGATQGRGINVRDRVFATLFIGVQQYMLSDTMKGAHGLSLTHAKEQCLHSACPNRRKLLFLPF